MDSGSAVLWEDAEQHNLLMDVIKFGRKKIKSVGKRRCVDWSPYLGLQVSDLMMGCLGGWGVGGVGRLHSNLNLHQTRFNPQM